MATSKIKIYQTVLTPTRNALVDDLDTYLNQLTPTYSKDDFQYIKFDLDLSIKVPMPQNVISGHSLGNYVRIEQDSKVWYYFVMNTEWKSANAVELKLSVDSINTFRNDLTFSEKTLIKRQHGDRLLKQTKTETPQNTFLIRTIDKTAEQIPANKIVSQSGIPVLQKSATYNWYLIYKTREDLTLSNPGNPIDCYCVADHKLKISNASTISSKTYTYADFNEGVYYYFNDLDNNNCIVDGHTIGSSVITVTRVTYISSSVPQYARSAVKLRGIVLYRQGNQLYYAYQFDQNVVYNTNVYSTIAPAVFGSTATPQTSNLSGKPFKSISSITITKGNFFRYSSTYYSIPEQAYLNAKQTLAAYIGQVAVYTNSFQDVDKTDSRLIKIIKLPYAPCTITRSNGVFTFPSDWVYTNGFMKLNDASLSKEFLNADFGTVSINNEMLIFHSTTIEPTELRNIKYESKLYHSDFYTFKLEYDSFAKEIALERYNTKVFDDTVVWKPSNVFFSISFKPTNTINSNFAFFIDPEIYSEDDASFATYQQNTDYESYLLISRNNEETIFSNDYLNYIRTGYNYDKKTKEEQASKSYLLAGVQLAAGIGSFAASAFTGGVSAAAGISLVSGAISTFSSAAYTQASSERSLQAKLANLAAQSTGVSGADDVDLLTYYNRNRLLIIKYETEPIQRQAIYNLFFYCGYKCDRMEKPNTTSRYWFNFLQCTPIFTEEGITPYNDYISDVKSRYEAGVTVYHHHAGVGTGWDWEQKYENWETTLIN